MGTFPRILRVWLSAPQMPVGNTARQLWALPPGWDVEECGSEDLGLVLLPTALHPFLKREGLGRHLGISYFIPRPGHSWLRGPVLGDPDSLHSQHSPPLGKTLWL